jgi:hypothetical protein
MTSSSDESRDLVPGADKEKPANRPISSKMPPQAGRLMGNHMLALDALILKAAVDPAFCELLLDKRAEAAAELGLELAPSAAGMLQAVPREQLEKIINNMTVPDPARRVFLGKTGYKMLLFLSGWMIFPLMGLGTACLPFLSMTGISALDTAFKYGESPRIGKRPVRIEGRPEGRRLDVRIVDDCAGSLTVNMRYDNPFDNGDIRVVPINYQGRRLWDVLCAPKCAKIRMGSGAFTFRLSAAQGQTHWILAGLSLDDRRLLRYEPWRLLKELESGEYDFILGPEAGSEQQEDLLAVWSVVKYHKDWESSCSA